MKHKKALGPVSGVALLALAAVASLADGAATTGDSAESRPGEAAVRRVRVAPVEPAVSTRVVRFAGIVRAADRAHLSFPLGARLAQRPVQVGDALEKGQLVARLDDREMANAVDAASAALAEIVANRRRVAQDLERVERLFAAEAATREEIDAARQNEQALAAAAQAAESRLRDARRRLSEATLTAPWAGSVTRVAAEPGEFVRPGETVVSLSGSGALEVEVGLPESMAVDVGRGTRVGVELPLAGGRSIGGRVERVGRAAAGGGALFPAIIALDPDSDLLPGMTAEVLFSVGGEGSGLVAVPLAAVLNPGGRQPEVFRLDGGRVVRIEVEVDSLAGDRVAVRGDLPPGSEVVVTGHTSLLDGDRVEVTR